MRKMKTMAATMALTVAFSAGAAFATTTAPIKGTNAAEVLLGTRLADTVYAYGGADLVRAISPA